MTEQNKNAENKGGEKSLVSIKDVQDFSKVKLNETLEFTYLKAIHEKFIKDTGEKTLNTLTGCTTIGNIACISSGYVTNKLGTKPSLEKCMDVLSDAINSKKTLPAHVELFVNLCRCGAPCVATYEKAHEQVKDLTLEEYNTYKTK